MSDAFELCVGHFHFMLDIFLFNIKTLDSVIKNSHIYAKIWDILTPTQTFGLLDNLTMCQTFLGQNVGHKEENVGHVRQKRVFHIHWVSESPC